MIENYQKSSHFLQQVNPTMKLFSILAVIFFMIPIFDPWTPLVLLILSNVMIISLGGISLRLLMKFLVPISLFAFSFIWINVFFPNERGETILFLIGSIPVALENVKTGISLALRSMIFVTWSLLFVFTTEPTKFMLSLIQHCKLPPRFGYGMLAAFRFLPLFMDELKQVRTAHRIRGLGEPKSLMDKVREIKRFMIPLLANAIRKAERVAIAMESKGFDGSRDRSYYTIVPWTRKDILFGVGLVTIFTGLTLIRKGYFL